MRSARTWKYKKVLVLPLCTDLVFDRELLLTMVYSTGCNCHSASELSRPRPSVQRDGGDRGWGDSWNVPGAFNDRQSVSNQVIVWSQSAFATFVLRSIAKRSQALRVLSTETYQSEVYSKKLTPVTGVYTTLFKTTYFSHMPRVVTFLMKLKIKLSIIYKRSNEINPILYRTPSCCFCFRLIRIPTRKERKTSLPVAT